MSTAKSNAPDRQTSGGILRSFIENTPASYFGMVLGLAGIANAWRAATEAWQLPPVIGEVIYSVAGLVWLALLLLYASKAIFASEKLAAELAHPIQCCFIGLGGVATMLVAGGIIPYSVVLAYVVFTAGFSFMLWFGVWKTGHLWQGGRDPSTTTAVLYLPTVGGSFVAATVVSAFGYTDWGQLAFGAGLFSWLAIESVLIHRLFTGPSKPAGLRPSLGIQLAPAPVAAVAYISVSGGNPDVFVHALIGYAILQVLILARLTKWIAEAGAVPALWAFSFGASAIAAAPVRLISHGDQGAMTILAPVLFVIGNVVIAGLSVMTMVLLVKGRMFAAETRPRALPNEHTRIPA